jgi:hypothetical protein
MFESSNGKSETSTEAGKTGCGSSSAGSSGESGSGSGSSRFVKKRALGAEQDGSGEDPDRPNSFKKKKEESDSDDDDEEEDEEESETEDQASSSNPGTPAVVQPNGAAGPSQQGLAPNLPGQAAGQVIPNQGNQAYREGNKDWLSYKELMATTYPVKSRNCYLSAYLSLEKYLKSKGEFHPDSPPDELSILNFFHHLCITKKWAATTLWSYFSRVNAVMKRSWGVNLTKYPRLTELLKGFESGQKIKKASVFSPQQV